MPTQHPKPRCLMRELAKLTVLHEAGVVHS
jgi:hypothetical protein